MNGVEPPAVQNDSQAPAQGHRVLTEGKARISQQGNEVFFNPAQVVNRDVSIAVLNHFAAIRKAELESGTLKRQKPAKKGGIMTSAEASEPRTAGLRLLEGLAATGLRAIRYASEVEGIERVDANDLDPTALEAMKRNLELTGEPAASRVHPMQGDARLAMLQKAGLYDAVDLDPYGSPSHFLDSAVQAVAEGGLLLVTATDMAVLCGNNGEACWAKYGSYPLHRSYCHEQALRILLASIESHANRYRRHIVPVLSLSIDFYVRVFVRVYTSPLAVKDSPTKLAYVFQSRGCDSFYLQSVGRKNVKGNSVSRTPGLGPVVPQACEQTGSAFLMGGPMWSQPLHDPAWVAAVHQLVLDHPERYPAHKKVASVLTSVAEELQDMPLYYDLHALCKTVHCSPPPADVLRSAIVNAGFRVSGTHANPLGLKTDCPPAALWDLIRGWVALHPVGRQLEPGSAAAKILAAAPTIKANFARAAGAISAARASKTARFLPNPEANWGPRPKHGRSKAAEPTASAPVLELQAPPATAAIAAVPTGERSPPHTTSEPQPAQLPALRILAAESKPAPAAGKPAENLNDVELANGTGAQAALGDAEMADAEPGTAVPRNEAVLQLLGDRDADEADW